MPDRILTAEQLIAELRRYNHRELHVHHTWKPNHADFNGKNHLTLQQNMRNYHVDRKKWSDIGQHVTLMPDGLFVTGRHFDRTPASITGYNTGAFCVEMLGDFDKGHDKFEGEQKAAMLKLADFFDERKRYVRFHNENSAKTCPGTSIVKADFMREVREPKPVVKAKVVYALPGGVLRKGDEGSAVKQLQTALNAAGYKCGTVDGDFGAKTVDAVKRFQSKYRLVADGVYGPKTKAKLAEVLK